MRAFSLYNIFMKKVIKQNFFLEQTSDVARNLLGMILCRRLEDDIIFKGKIVETEAYIEDEPSCHAYIGKTKRNAPMFEKGGISYVYFTYGMHYCLNIVTEKENRGAAVLIRAIEPLNTKIVNTNGPAKLCKALNITKELNGINICDNSSDLWLEYGTYVEENEIVQTTRIGIKKAAELPYRFYIKGNKFVSKP